MPRRYAGLTLSAWKQAGCTSRIIFPPARRRSRRASRVVEHTAALVLRGRRRRLRRSLPRLERPRPASRPVPRASTSPRCWRLCAAYVRRTGSTSDRRCTRHWKLGSLLGLVFGVALVRNVLTEDATPHPDGAYYVFELIWRGGVYGAVDALLLTVLPCLIVYRSLGGRLTTWRRRLAYFGVVARPREDDHRRLPPRLHAIPRRRRSAHPRPATRSSRCRCC